MRNFLTGLTMLLTISLAKAQENIAPLTVEKIMRDPKWIGTQPSNPYWSLDGKYLFFDWNPDNATSDSLYYITPTDNVPKKAGYDLRQGILTQQAVKYNAKRNAYVYTKNGDIFLTDVKSGKTKVITQTVDFESSPVFTNNDTRIVYSRSQNLFAFDLGDGTTIQLTNFVRGGAAPATQAPAGAGGRGGGGFAGARQQREVAAGNQQEAALKTEQLQLFEVLKERKKERDESAEWTKGQPKTKSLKTIMLDDRNMLGLAISPDGRFVTYRLAKSPTGDKNTIIPNFITESGFTTDINGRTKVGAPLTSYESFVYDTQNDTVITVKTSEIPGIFDAPDYAKDYPSKDSIRRKAPRNVNINGPFWSDNGKYAVVDIRAQDNKDRWIMLLDPATGALSLLDRQRDEAWIAGPGIGFGFGNAGSIWINDNTIWFQSEATGYSHLYKINVETKEKTTLTSGNYEVQRTQLSSDKKNFFITTNAVHPG
ncbi:MAG: DPP IV N-terminal domain-containing protein, partial [Flavitalea sp.]